MISNEGYTTRRLVTVRYSVVMYIHKHACVILKQYGKKTQVQM